MDSKKSPDEVVREALDTVIPDIGEVALSKTLTIPDANGIDREVQYMSPVTDEASES